MTYTLEQASRVATQLEKLATYNVHQLAGQFPNLEFWLGEAIHALQVIDDYTRRFKSMRDAQERWVNDHGTTVSDDCPICGGACEFGPVRPKAPTRIPAAELDAARRSVRDGAYHFLLRLHRVGWIDKDRLMAECERVGTSVDLADLEPR